MTNNWCSRIIAVTVVFNCAGGPLAWAQMNQAPGKQQMQSVAPLALTRVVPTSYGYDLIGTGFGIDKNKLQIFEGVTQLTGSAVISLAGDKIAVQSKPSGSVLHKIVVAGQSSGLSYTHPVASKPPAPSDKPDAATVTSATAPRRLALGSLSASGHRAETGSAKRVALGTLSASGHRDSIAPAKRLSLGALSAEGWKQ